MTVSFALLESVLQELMTSFINDHQRIGQIISHELSFKRLCSLIQRLYLAKHGEDQDFAALMSIIKKSKECEEERNKITHSVWAAGQDSTSVTRIKPSTGNKKFTVNSEAVNDTVLGKIVNDLKTLANEVLSLRIQLIKTGKAYNNPAGGTP